MVNDWKIEIGNSLPDCRQNMRWAEVPAKEFLSRYPFDRQLCFLNPETTVIWTDNIVRQNSWPTYVIGVFGDTNKTHLVDLLRIRDGFKCPQVNGVYNKTLAGIREGMSINSVYEKIGVEECDYFLHKDGRWHVRFLYYGLNGSYIIEADAATGVVLSAKNGTI